ncbi:hypothetical protein CC85DRAFT_302874 [Cutaneotrichosporon oleaginosum]|uniref:Phenylacetaldoxime dehydratase n=1 Tax=Cutaneotrichosporon oleaginosum TaxID=879819 RepID=A0A0J0XL31_9TREE|nr:uncharacterized protein CC85DRAFT_302874 [Cutaneotrichosporon oleaginosum]KLT41848.1 hypothetical protein CC85DRAFT_302874 [Cutaneotrichosporon oleaginosum]TXT14768.1 hypothetical protein COLE_00961 [Cutaneotrichosporon oleaginosum]
MSANPRVDPPPSAYRPATARIQPRKPESFVPAVQRWSALLPPTLVVGTFGVQARSLVPDSPFLGWARDALAPSAADAPCTSDHARHTDAAGYTHHVVVAYWRDPAAYARWAAAHEGFWDAAAEAREEGEGVYREVLSVPADRAETIFWPDYPGGLMCDADTPLYPTPYCGYYGAMRDRLPAAGDDALAGPALDTGAGATRDTRGRRRVRVPQNIAVIRSAHTWQFMDAEQRADYERRLRPPLDRGMAYLSTPESGCLSLRWLTVTDERGAPRPEAHATAYFASLGHMEAWAEGHRTHAAIFGAAVARYKHYGASNQLRTWHEVFIIPEGQVFEYINCHPQTGLLPYFDSERVE